MGFESRSQTRLSKIHHSRKLYIGTLKNSLTSFLCLCYLLVSKFCSSSSCSSKGVKEEENKQVEDNDKKSGPILGHLKESKQVHFLNFFSLYVKYLTFYLSLLFHFRFEKWEVVPLLPQVEKIQGKKHQLSTSIVKELKLNLNFNLY